jgi:hypothetical protein
MNIRLPWKRQRGRRERAKAQVPAAKDKKRRREDAALTLRAWLAVVAAIISLLASLIKLIEEALGSRK